MRIRTLSILATSTVLSVLLGCPFETPTELSDAARAAAEADADESGLMVVENGEGHDDAVDDVQNVSWVDVDQLPASTAALRVLMTDAPVDAENVFVTFCGIFVEPLAAGSPSVPRGDAGTTPRADDRGDTGAGGAGGDGADAQRAEAERQRAEAERAEAERAEAERAEAERADPPPPPEGEARMAPPSDEERDEPAPGAPPPPPDGSDAQRAEAERERAEADRAEAERAEAEAERADAERPAPPEGTDGEDAPTSDGSRDPAKVDEAERDPRDVAAGAGWQTVSDECRTVDLLTLRDGVTEAMGISTLPPGNYGQIRLMLVDASVVVGGVEHELTVPSGDQRGIAIGSGFSLRDGEAATITLDFDAGKSIRLTEGNGYMMSPVISVVGMTSHGGGEDRDDAEAPAVDPARPRDGAEGGAGGAASVPRGDEPRTDRPEPPAGAAGAPADREPPKADAPPADAPPPEGEARPADESSPEEREAAG
jgi:hypothetical protein